MTIHPSFGDVWQALNVALAAHQGHRRKVSGAPYCVHLTGVLDIILRYGFPEHPLGIAGVLHDTIEHGLWREEQIERQFGPDVVRLVVGVTPRGERHPWRRRKEADVERLRWADDELIILACADKFHNLLAIESDAGALGPKAWERLKRSPAEVAWNYRLLGEMFAERANEHPRPKLLLDFAAKVTQVFGEIHPRA